jgi:FkbM family methyltransferase
MEKLTRILKESVWAVRSIRNFPLYFADRLHLLRKPYILKMRNGISYSLRQGIDHTVMVEEIWYRAAYDMALVGLKDGATVVDIGASIGIFSVKAAKSAKNVKVIACEPMAETEARLVANSALNGLVVDARNVAVSGHSGRLTLYHLPSSVSGGSTNVQLTGHSPIEVNCVSLDDLLRDIPSVDLLKCDCDGSEEDVFYNASPETLKKVGAIVMEWHEYISKKGMPAFMEFLKKNGFSPKFYGTITNTIYAPRSIS